MTDGDLSRGVNVATCFLLRYWDVKLMGDPVHLSHHLSRVIYTTTKKTIQLYNQSSRLYQTVEMKCLKIEWKWMAVWIGYGV